MRSGTASAFATPREWHKHQATASHFRERFEARIEMVASDLAALYPWWYAC